MYEKMLLKRFCFPVTFNCNLKCRLCSEGVPYNKKVYYPSEIELINQVDKFLELFSHVEKFDITGGEPLLYKDLDKIIKYIFDKYNNMFDILRITTNGTILPDSKILNLLKTLGNKIFIIVDKYKVSEKADEIDELLNINNIPHELRDYNNLLHCNGWVDYGDLLLKWDNSNVQRIFDECIVPKLGFFICLVDWKIFPCARARLCYENGKTADYVDLKQNSSDCLIQLKNLIQTNKLESCKYCNGLRNSSQRYMPAEQLLEKKGK